MTVPTSLESHCLLCDYTLSLFNKYSLCAYEGPATVIVDVDTWQEGKTPAPRELEV